MKHQEEFSRIYDEYAKRVYALALKLCKNTSTAEDLLAETMARAFGNLRQDGETTDLFPWLSRVCYNLFVDLRRRERTCDRYMESLRMVPEREDCRFGNHQELHVTWKTVGREINALTMSERSCVLLFVAGHSYTQISELTGITKMQTRNSLHSAMRKLRKRFKTNGNNGNHHR